MLKQLSIKRGPIRQDILENLKVPPFLRITGAETIGFLGTHHRRKAKEMSTPCKLQVRIEIEKWRDLPKRVSNGTI